MSYSIGWVTGRTFGLQQHLSPANLRYSPSEDQYGTQPNIRENNPAKQKPKVVNSRIEHGRRAGRTCTVNRLSQLRIRCTRHRSINVHQYQLEINITN